MALCKTCGREVAAGARWCPDCGTPQGRTARCRSCGNEFPYNLGKCHRCGAVGAAAYGPKYTVSLMLGVLVIILIFAGLCLFGWYQHSRDVAEQQRWFEEQKRGR
jgi:hypothetical protein